MKISLKLGIAAASLMSLAIFTLPQAKAAPPSLNIFIWANYIPPSLITAFEAKCGCKINQNNYNSNGEMLAKLEQGGDAQYDIVVPSSDYVGSLQAQGLIQPINHAALPNFENLDAVFQNPSYDKQDQYSIPYQWGTVGIVYDTTKFTNPPQSWGLLFDQKLNPNYPFVVAKGEAHGEIATACLYLGYGANCSEKDQWVAAAKLMRQTKARSNFSGFVDPTLAVEQMKHGQYAVSMAYNGQVAGCQLDKSCPHLKFFLPKEGAIAWVDTLVIPSHAPHPELALEFINFILDAKNGANLSEYNQYASPNQAAMPYMADIVANPVITPPASDRARLTFMSAVNPKDAKLLNQIWTSALQ